MHFESTTLVLTQYLPCSRTRLIGARPRGHRGQLFLAPHRSDFRRYAIALIAGWLFSALALSAEPGKDRIVFQGGTPARFGLFISNADGSNERPLLTTAATAYNPSFSADGKWITFTSEQDGSPDIYRVHPDGSGIERLTDSPSFEDQSALSPDGGTLAFGLHSQWRGGEYLGCWISRIIATAA